MKYFTSDWHLGHESIIRHCYRPFSLIEMMDHTILANYFTRVTDEDEVYFLGDFAWRVYYYREILPYLPGKIFFIPGNHDEKILKSIPSNVTLLPRLVHIKHCGYRLTLSHYPLASWLNSEHGAIHLHGHCHGLLAENKDNRFDVGVDAWRFWIVSLEEILTMRSMR